MAFSRPEMGSARVLGQRRAGPYTHVFASLLIKPSKLCPNGTCGTGHLTGTTARFQASGGPLALASTEFCHETVYEVKTKLVVHAGVGAIEVHLSDCDAALVVEEGGHLRVNCVPPSQAL